MEEVELKLEQDRTEYFYMREETFTVRFTRIISSSSNIIKLLRKISWHYTLVQKSNYNITLINQSMELIEDLERLLHIYKMNNYLIYSSHWGYYYKWEGDCFIDSLKYRLNFFIKQNLLEKRSIKRVLGNFEESISPNMIQKILTWLKRKDKDKYGRIKRGIKEEIIIELSKCGITINPEFLCEFIDNNNPMNFIKEWKIKPYINGKRMKNTEIRKLFKEAFYKRERDCVRFKIISPSLNSLPQNIETMIISYL